MATNFEVLFCINQIIDKCVCFIHCKVRPASLEKAKGGVREEKEGGGKTKGRRREESN